MPEIERLQFQITIRAPRARVAAAMIGSETYKQWTAAFAEGSYFEGDWAEGSRMKFLAPNGDGMLSEIAEHRPDEFISVRHIGMVIRGVEDTESDAVKSWAPAYENYTLRSIPEGTQVVVDQDASPAEAESLKTTWGKALGVLKQLCEASGG